MAKQKTLVFRTREDDPADTTIVGAPGLAAGYGRGGIVVERVAETAHELQSEAGKPLTGAALRKAAEQFAEARGLTVDEVDAERAETLTQDELGFPPDRPPAHAVSAAEGRRIYGSLIDQDFAGRQEAARPANEEGVLPATEHSEPPADVAEHDTSHTTDDSQEG